MMATAGWQPRFEPMPLDAITGAKSFLCDTGPEKKEPRILGSVLLLIRDGGTNPHPWRGARQCVALLIPSYVNQDSLNSALLPACATELPVLIERGIASALQVRHVSHVVVGSLRA